MPEIKNTFTAGRMNKDLDERLVPNGQYRDAMNVQVRTTDGDAAGTVQNLQGNELIGSSYLTQGYDQKKSKMIASVADEKNDASYFFSAAPIPDGGIKGIPHTTVDSEVIWIDSITEFKAAPTYASTPVFVDRFAITTTSGLTFGPFANEENFSSLSVLDRTKYRIGMILTIQDENGNHLIFDTDGSPGAEIIKIEESSGFGDNPGTIFLNSIQNVNLYTEALEGNITSSSCVKFIHPERVLEFNYNKNINSINIIDELLFWTDNNNEPKKINIKRSKAGTINNSTHTKLYVNNPIIDELVAISGESLSPENLNTADIKKEHITVIRKKPVNAPHLHMRNSTRDSIVNFTLLAYSFANDEGVIPAANQKRFINIGNQIDGTGGFPEDMQILIGDVFTFTDNTVQTNPIVVRASVESISNMGTITLDMLFVDPDLSDSNTSWSVELEQRQPIFESKFGRFAYRYKYEDNEYSAFSPWSELAFLPGSFSYIPSKAFNEGMVNNLRSLVIRNFIPKDSMRPSDVKEVDILWKTTDDQNVYIVKTIKRFIDKEWNTEFSLNNLDNTGVITITSEMINRALPSNQLLRGWDNVPKKALAQEITASRLIYGNYEQGYNINDPIGIKQSVISEQVPLLLPKKSVKSIRNYRFGVVYGDMFGRETPVIANGYIDNLGQSVSGDISVAKSLSAFSNKFQLQQNWEDIEVDPPKFLEYAKYYVKETSNEYYNLVMDRFYEAKDNNVWLSFPSADRNKIDEETYLILKNEQGSQVAVDEIARFKVIAISNEAPDFIKTSNRKFKRILIKNQADIYGNSVTDDGYAYEIGQAAVTNGAPTKLALVRSFSLDLRNISTLPDSAENLRMRFVGRYIPGAGNTFDNYQSLNIAAVEVFSPFINVTAITDMLVNVDGQITQPCELNIEKSFTTEEINMYQKILALGYASEIDINKIDDPSDESYIEYSMELVSRNLENLPEFDGRFFVKIEKTDILKKRLLIEQNIKYNVLKTFQISYISSDFKNPANDNNANAANMDFEDKDLSDYTDANSFADFNTEEEINTFGDDANETNTINFWNWHQSKVDANISSAIFLDNAKCRQASPNINYSYFLSFPGLGIIDDLAAAGGNTIQNQANNSLTTISDFETSRPAGLTSVNQNLNDMLGQQIFGAAIDGNQKNLMFFSCNNTGDALAFQSGTQSEFRSRMQNGGTLFRFTDDPNQEVYRVKPVVLPDYEEFGADTFNEVFDTNISDGGNSLINVTNMMGAHQNFATNTANRFRKTIFVFFVRVNKETGADINGTGVDISEWDPRGTVQHNGIGTFGIEFIEPIDDIELTSVEVITNNACWETEPKKDIDLDIYYEASPAIPMVLKSNNIESYVQGSFIDTNASIVRVEKRDLINSSGNVVSFEKPIEFDVLKIAIVTGDNVISVSRKNTLDEFIPETTNILQAQPGSLDGILNIRHSIYLKSYIFIDDLVSFANRNGTVTRSKILDHIQLTKEGQALPSFRTQIKGAGVNFTFETNANGEQGFATIKTLADISELKLGMEVRAVNGTFVQRGTMVIALLSNPNPAIPSFISLNRSLLDTGEFTFEFIETTGSFSIDKNVWKYPIQLGWFNCYSFGNGVESDRIRDDFNAPQIDNGCRVSSTFLEYGQERITNGLIYSGLYNSTSSVNNLNEFNMAEKIVKNINSTYGSIQAMKTRDTDVVVFTQDKVLKVLANKDAVFNADGNPQLTATNRVLGQAIPFAGDYGISDNPESLASDQYRLYFTDKQRGAVLRLSADGLTPISDVGMKSYFRKKLRLCDEMLGTFDKINGEYNLTMNVAQVNQTATEQTTTVSFNEASKGWISFKSFIPLTGVSFAGSYLTASENSVYKHYSDNVDRNTFYGNFAESEIELLFNDVSNVVKSFKAVSYEGSQSKVDYNVVDGEFYNLNPSGKEGWYVQSFTTDLQEGSVPEFIQKEGKWFNKINGTTTSLANLDPSEFSVQGIGFPTEIIPNEVLDDITINISDIGDTP
tara:strand:+ start:27 stop:6020 length:5994 start_codon:yes stop_codon:yes gene_type:complete